MWYLNRFLTSWRDRANIRFPRRGKSSDGSVGDLRHQAGYSEHNPDRDGSVDAWDMDVNVLGSADDTGTPYELKIIEKLKAEFEALPQSQLWIHDGQIANRDIRGWRRRPYYGANAHRRHVHWQSRPSQEDKPIPGAPLVEYDEIVDAINDPGRTAAKRAPDWPIADSKSFACYQHDAPYYKTVERAQRRLRERGWKVKVDGRFGPATEHVIILFQREKGLDPDGRLGPKTWRALWATKITD